MLIGIRPYPGSSADATGLAVMSGGTQTCSAPAKVSP